MLSFLPAIANLAIAIDVLLLAIGNLAIKIDVLLLASGNLQLKISILLLKIGNLLFTISHRAVASPPNPPSLSSGQALKGAVTAVGCQA
jgi:hypothetical protein